MKTITSNTTTRAKADNRVFLLLGSENPSAQWQR